MKIKDQKIEDLGADITFIIKSNPEGGMTLNYYFGYDPPFYCRTIQFGRNGRIEQTGTSMGIKRVV